MPRASLKQRKDGRFCAVYKGVQFMGDTQSEAYQKRDAFKRQAEAGLRQEAGNVGLLQYATTWAHLYKKSVTERTFGDYTRCLSAFVKVVGDKRIADVVPSDVKKAYNSLTGYSYSYVSMYTQLVKAMFSAAVADRILLFNPCLSIKPPKAEAGTHRAISEGERQLILRSAHRFAPAAMTMLYAGLRRGEVLALNVDRDVDFAAMTITVREAVRFDANTPIIADPKTEAGKRTIPLLDVLADVLRPLHGLVAPSVSGGLMSETSVKKAWSSFLRTLGGDPPVRIRMHDLRHSFCTMLYDAGIDIKTAMKWMGHADQTMTLRIYTHLTSEREAAAANKLRHAVNDHLKKDMQNDMQTVHDTPVSAAV